MTVTAHNVTASALQVTVSSVLTAIPGITKLDFSPGENVTYEKGALNSTYDEVQDSGVQSGATLSGSLMWDPLDTVHQFIQRMKNDSHVVSTVYTPIVGNLIIGASEVEIPVSLLVTKWDIKGERKNGFIVDFEFKCTARVELNEADPS